MEEYKLIDTFYKLSDFAKKYNYTYETVKTNWKNIEERQLRNFDRKITKEKINGNKVIIKVYEKESIKNTNLPNEVWKDSISNTLIQVSNMGRIKVKKDGLMTYGSLSSKGYMTYGKRDGKETLVHRLVAEVFLPNENKENLYIDHIDGDRTNNKVENLRWVSPLQNSFYKDENQRKLHEKLNTLIKKYGYNYVEELLNL